MYNPAGHGEVFEGYKAHSAGPRVSTESVVLDLLRKSYPDFYITCASLAGCDIRGFAQAGHATIVKDADEETFDSTRIYSAPGPRLENNPGSVVQHTRFGRWLYTWNDMEYILYEVETATRMGVGPVVLFILSPRGEDTEPHAAADELLTAIGAWSAVLHDEIYVFDNGRWTKSHELWESIQGSSWDEVILNPDMKANLIQDVQGFFDNKHLYKKLAVPWKRGLIMHGVPGNGKTLSIKALISALYEREVPVPSLYVKSVEARNGNNHNSIRNIFTLARSMAPCLLIFEDLDSLVTPSTRSYFLNEVDGLESNDGILMVGSTNHLELLDPAISRRPSRFDRKYQFKMPEEDERVAYCHYWRNKLIGDENDMLDFPVEICTVIAKLTGGFSFAYLKELFVTALMTIVRGGAVDSEEVDLPVMVRRADAVENGSEAEKVEEERNDTEPIPKKRTIPDVEIPASLKDNLLLKVIRAHLKTLLDEMDNTKEEDWSSSKNEVKGVLGMNPPRAIRPNQLGVRVLR